jgi:hypothetical protein
MMQNTRLRLWIRTRGNTGFKRCIKLGANSREGWTGEKLNAAPKLFPVARKKRDMSKRCPETASNRHVLLRTRDFKSRASASFAIQACGGS